MKSSRPVVRPDLIIREVNGELVVLDRRGGKVHQLNATASYIWHCCNGRSNPKGIAESLAERYGIEITQAEGDVEATIAKFRELGLLSNSND